MASFNTRQASAEVVILKLTTVYGRVLMVSLWTLRELRGRSPHRQPIVLLIVDRINSDDLSCNNV